MNSDNASLKNEDTFCVIDPYIFEYCFELCHGNIDAPLSLKDLQYLSIFAEACVLHDEVIVPNPLTPTFRHKFNPNDIIISRDRYTERDILEYRIQQNLQWQFVNYKINLGGLGHTDWFHNFERSFTANQNQDATDSESRASLEKLKLDGKLSESEVELLTVLILESDIDIDLLSYLDKYAVLAEQFKATLVFERDHLGSYLKGYEKLFQSPEKEILAPYEESLHKELLAVSTSGFSRYRTVSFYAPLFISKAVFEARTREAVLNNIADFHNYIAVEFRSLSRHLRTCSPKEYISIRKDIEDLLTNLASDTRIPKPNSRPVRVLLNIISLFGSAIKLDPVDAVKNAYELDSTISEKDKSKVYSGLSFMNQIHDEIETSEQFYKELQRVFGRLNFNEQELNHFLGKRD